MCIPHIVARQRLDRHVPVPTNRSNIRRIVGDIVFYTVLVVSKESLWVCVCIPLSLPGNGSVNIFPWQRRFVGGVVFHAVRVVSKERRRLALNKTCFFKLCHFLYKNKLLS
jgi:hypothetical protein